MSIGVGIIGCGGVVSRLHLPALRRLPNARVTALAGTSPETLDHAATRFEVPSRYADYRTLIQDSSVDAVAVCVPPDQHTEVALAAMAAQKPVFVEKPLALSVRQCQQLVDAAKADSITHLVGFHLRWHQLVREARQWILDDRLGKLEVLRTLFTSGIRFSKRIPAWRSQRPLGGGVLIELGVHHYDLWRFLTRSTVEDITVVNRHGVNALGMRQEDTAAIVTGRLASGCLATASFSEGSVDSLEIDIVGTRGRLQLDAYGRDGLRFSPIGYKGLKKLAPVALSLPSRLAHAVRAIPRGGYYAHAYVKQWAAFIESITSGNPVGASFTDGREATRIALAATQSAQLGKTVRIADVDDRIAAPTA